MRDPDFVYLKQVVFLTDTGMQVVGRPAPYLVAFTQGLVRVPYPSSRVAIPVVRAVQAEPDGEAVPGPVH